MIIIDLVPPLVLSLNPAFVTSVQVQLEIEIANQIHAVETRVEFQLEVMVR